MEIPPGCVDPVAARCLWVPTRNPRRLTAGIRHTTVCTACYAATLDRYLSSVFIRRPSKAELADLEQS